MSTRELFLFIWSLLLSLTLAVVIVKLYQTPVIVSFDLQRSVKQFSLNLSNKKLSESDTNRLTKIFSERLISITEAYAVNHHVVIVVSPAVVSGAKDVTEDLQENIYRALSSER